MKNDSVKTTLTLENGYGKYTVEIPEMDLSIASMFDLLVIPVLLASGYAEGSIENYLNA